MKETIKSLKEKIKKYEDKENTSENEDNQATGWRGQITKILSDFIYQIPNELSDKDYAVISKKIGKTIFTEDELNKELKKYKTEPATKKSKKTIEVDENGIMKPIGFSKEENKLVGLIDVDKYLDDTIIEIIKGIGKGTIKKVSDFPEPDNKPEPEPEPKKTKGGVRPGAGRKPKAVEPEPVKEVKPLSKATIKANADKAKKKLKEAEAKKKADAKEAKRLKNIKPYFKADDPPKGFREATPIEAIKEKKVMLYGKKKLDSKLIDSMFKPAANSKDMIQSIMIKIASKVPKLKNLKAVIDGMEGDERYDSTDKKAEFAKLRAEILALSEKKKKLEAKK